jgi:hypothetical protein
MKCSHINTREIHPAYRAVSLSGPARLPYKQALNSFFKKAFHILGVMAARGILTNPAMYAGYDSLPLQCIQDWVNTTSLLLLAVDLLTWVCFTKQCRAADDGQPAVI